MASTTDRWDKDFKINNSLDTERSIAELFIAVHQSENSENVTRRFVLNNWEHWFQLSANDVKLILWEEKISSVQSLNIHYVLFEYFGIDTVKISLENVAFRGDVKSKLLDAFENHKAWFVFKEFYWPGDKAKTDLEALQAHFVEKGLPAAPVLNPEDYIQNRSIEEVQEIAAIKRAEREQRKAERAKRRAESSKGRE